MARDGIEGEMDVKRALGRSVIQYLCYSSLAYPPRATE